MSVRILIIDDYQAHVDLLVNTANMYGGLARGCTDGREGLEITQEWSPHLIVCDGLLEGMRAWQFGQRYNNLPRVGVRPYMVALTGYSSRLQRSLCEEHGYDEYAVKPIELSTLLGWISKARERFKIPISTPPEDIKSETEENSADTK